LRPAQHHHHHRQCHYHKHIPTAQGRQAAGAISIAWPANVAESLNALVGPTLLKICSGKPGVEIKVVSEPHDRPYKTVQRLALQYEDPTVPSRSLMCRPAIDITAIGGKKYDVAPVALNVARCIC